MYVLLLKFWDGSECSTIDLMIVNNIQGKIFSNHFRHVAGFTYIDMIDDTLNSVFHITRIHSCTDLYLLSKH